MSAGDSSTPWCGGGFNRVMGNVISLDTIREDSGLYQEYLAA